MSHVEPPAGPARMRASDADRDRVSAVLRRNYEAGRLDDGDLDRRLSRVLAARTLGELREQISDLPPPPPSFGRRLRYGARAIRHPFAASAGAVLAVLLIIGAIAGNDRQTASPAPPLIPVPSGSAYPSEPADHITDVQAGHRGVDDGMAARVRGISRRSSAVLTYPKGARIFPSRGHEFAVADVEYSDRLSRPIEPFCGSDAGRLYSRAHIAYSTAQREYEVTGNDALCGGGIQPDETAIAHLVFDVPKHTRFAWIEVWNGDIKSPDILGHTRLRLHLDGIRGA